MVLQKTGDAFQIRYGTGKVIGDTARDTMSMGTPPLKVAQQAFGAVWAASPDFVGASCDGLVVGSPFSSLLLRMAMQDACDGGSRSVLSR